MTGIVITGGECPSYKIVKNIIDDADYIIAADSGLDYCADAGITPQYIIGDMDSLRDDSLLEAYPSRIVERHPPKKDYTDTELALQHLYEKGMDRVLLIGGGGGRADHFLAIYSLYYRDQKPDFWITHNSLFRLIKGNDVIKTVPGEDLSLFPITKNCRMISTGLYWPLDQLRWNLGDFGISNRAIGKQIQIEMLSGELLMIQDLETAFLPN